MNTHRENFLIAASHPALPGHFPGNPVVPGVVLLDHLIVAIARVWGLHVIGLPQVKFLRPLRPEQQAQTQLEREAGRVRFKITAGENVIASGMLEVAA